MRTVRLLGLDFADLGATEAVHWVLDRPAGNRFDFVVTPNADHLVRLAHDPTLAAIYRDAAMRLLDSRVVARAARAIGLPAPRVVTGSDLTAMLLSRLRRREYVTIIGLRRAWLPALIARTGIVPAHLDPPMGFDADPAAMDAAVRFVLDHPARLVFLAVGSPRQERLAAAVKATGLASGLGLCIGSSLEFAAGVAPRAPLWLQVAGFEWLHRLGRDPRRLARRYLLEDPAIFPLLLGERWRHNTALPPLASRGRGEGAGTS
jgi:N-acetylglucosaminyldiphosphoundecaprenol N-acetyl-beta-D-mannosaminyltransferase